MERHLSSVVEHPTRNGKAIGSNPIGGSTKRPPACRGSFAFPVGPFSVSRCVGPFSVSRCVGPSARGPGSSVAHKPRPQQPHFRRNTLWSTKHRRAACFSPTKMCFVGEIRDSGSSGSVLTHNPGPGCASRRGRNQGVILGTGAHSDTINK